MYIFLSLREHAVTYAVYIGALIEEKGTTIGLIYRSMWGQLELDLCDGL